MAEEKPEDLLVTKIKQEQEKEKEKESKVKSSSEILIELFGVFNAPPPSLEDLKNELSSAHNKKKSKKKHKHKDKKKKKGKKRGRSSSDSLTDSENEPVKKKPKKSKHKKHKKKSKVDHSVDSSDEEGSKKTRIKTENSEDIKEQIKVEVEIKPVKREKTAVEDIKPLIQNGETASIEPEPDLSNIKLPSETSSNNESTKSDVSADKSKSGSNKIQIKNLKYSAVFEETVKQVEEEARKRAEKYEEGEISSSSPEDSPSRESEGNDLITNMNLIQKFTERDSSPKSDKYEETYKSHSKKSDSTFKKHDKSPQRSHSRHKRSTSGLRHESSRSKRHSRSKSKEKYSRKKYNDSGKSSNSYKYSSRIDDKRSLYKKHDRRRSKERESRSEIDKKRLLEIARKNAINMLQNGSLPAALNLGQQAQQKVLSAIKSGGKSVDELTDFCKTLSRKEALGELSSVSSDNDSDNENGTSRPFHHPFQVKDKGPIVLNIKGGVPLPVQSFQEKTIEQTKNLRLQFPVSSGTQHRGAEHEWRPVSPPKPTPTLPKHIPNPPFFNSNKSPVPTMVPKPSETIAYTIQNDNQPSTIPGVAQPSIVPNVLPGPQVFPTDVQPTLDLGSIVSQRLSAIRKLQENPNDPSAMNQIYEVNKEMSKWAQSKQEPGQFTGSTGVQILTPKELASGIQAWAKPDQLQTAAPVTGGMGMHLLQKMGWRPGEGLGKQKNGSLTPLLLEVKLDTRGLVAKEESRGRNPKRSQGPTVKTLAGKHPVSLLGEFCSKRKLGVPSYSLCYESGPDHKKNFLFKVTVNGIEYQPNVASANKKQAKADAAQLCLQQLGLIS